MTKPAQSCGNFLKNPQNSLSFFKYSTKEKDGNLEYYEKKNNFCSANYPYCHLSTT